MQYQQCRCLRLVGNELGNVTVCQDCGQVFLTVQYMTLRFEADAFRALASLMGKAQSLLDGAGASMPKASRAAEGLH